MKVLKFLFCCLCWIVFVITAKAQIADTTIYYQFIERELNVPNSLAEVLIKNKKGQILAVCKSLAFDIDSSLQIQAQNSKTTLYLHQESGQVDSIEHDKVDFIYNINNRRLFLSIPSQENAPAFYTNSLHKIAIYTQCIEWQMDEGQLYFDHKERAISFESIHYFNPSRMEVYQSLGNTNPLVKMALYVQKKGDLKAWFDLKEMTLLLDKRLDKIVWMNSVEIEKVRKNPSFKIIKNKRDFEQFKKGYPTVFKFAGMNVSDLKNLMEGSVTDEKVRLPLYLRMVKDGFLDYNKNTKQVQLQDKLFHYVSAMNKKSDYDYDHLKFWSKPIRDSSGAYLNVKSQVLTILNVEQIRLGIQQEVMLKPSNSIRFLSNRNFNFDGQLCLGMSCFEGFGFQFEYDTYQVLLPPKNRLNLAIYKRERLKNEWNWNETSIGRTRALDERGEPTKEREQIQSVIEIEKGYLKIDEARNKSGKNEGDAKMPLLVSLLKSRVYYYKYRKDGTSVYPQGSFYYELEPFELNRMNRLGIEQISFKGKFYSSEILPIFKNVLNLQFYDLSLGFDTLIKAEEQVPIYLKEEAKGKGVFYGQLRLSNAGLIGNGVLTYLGASLGCDVIDFSPEQVVAKQVDSFNLEASENFPKIRARHIKMLWKPYKNQMYLNSLFTEGFPFHFYYKKQKYRLDGELRMNPKGLFGQGTLDWKQASMVSNPQGDYQIEANRIRSASVAVLLKIRGREQFGFEQENVRLELDFEKQRAYFRSKEVNSRANFPYNGYQTTLDQFNWDWKNNLLFMESSNDQKGVFRREESPLLGLYFEASKGVYDLHRGLLKLKELAPVKIGNALLYLEDSTLEIEADAYIQKLEGKLILRDSSLNPIYILNEVNLVWNDQTASFVSKGTSFELKRSVDMVSKQVSGKIEVLPTDRGLLVQYAWVLPNGDWCFLKWKNGALYGISNLGFMEGTLLGELKDFESFRANWL